MPPSSPAAPSGVDGAPRRRDERRRAASLAVLCGVLVVAVLLRDELGGLTDRPLVRTATTVFVAICVQALPFLVLGTLLSGLLAAVVSPRLLRRALPRHPALAVPAAGMAGVVLPGCECASVPVARRLIGQGAPDAAALAFLLSAPAINPVVLVATAVAFPGRPEIVVARGLASAVTAIGVGWLWQRFARPGWIPARIRVPVAREETSRLAVFAETARHDLVDAGGFLVVGGLAAAVLTVAVPASWLEGLAGQVVVAIGVMAVLAVLLALCSEADAFVAASLSALPLLPRLVFLVVGPAVDVKLVALHAGTFGRAFAVRFAPLAFAVAVVAALVVGLLVLPGGGLTP